MGKKNFTQFANESNSAYFRGATKPSKKATTKSSVTGRLLAANARVKGGKITHRPEVGIYAEIEKE